MDREWKDLMEEFMDYDLGLQPVNKLLSYTRKYHRRMGDKKLKEVLGIVLEILSRDVDLCNMENFIGDNFDYFNFIFSNINNRGLFEFKEVLFTTNFRTRDLSRLINYILKNLESLKGDLDFILRILERIFEKNICLKNINEFNPNREKWVAILWG